MLINEFPEPKRKLTPVKSIAFYCRYICCNNDLISWKNCRAVKCTLHKYRLGKRPQKNSNNTPINSRKKGCDDD